MSLSEQVGMAVCPSCEGFFVAEFGLDVDMLIST